MIDLSKIKKHLQAIARPRDIYEHPDTLREVQAYIEKEFQSYGYEIEKDPFEFNGQIFENVIARMPRQLKPYLLIGAHFDAVTGTPGADDNASGVAALLEAARICAAPTLTLPLQDEGGGKGRGAAVEFAAFNVEEYAIAGSAHYASWLKSQNEKLTGMISLEMVGYTSHEKGSQKIPAILKPFYPDTGNFLALVGDGNSQSLLKKAAAAFRNVGATGRSPLPIETLTVPAKGWLFPETRLSDHCHFWDAGIPALLVTDTSFFRNPHYHTPGDRIETLDLDFLSRVTEGVVRLVQTTR